MSTKASAVSIGLSAAIVAVEGEMPSVLVVSHEGTHDALPFGPFDPVHHRTLEQGLRKWVGEQTRFDLGYTEQLYTFGDLGRHRSARTMKQPGHDAGTRVVSVGYLALTRRIGEAPGTQWRGWYHYFPWEDWRDNRPAMIDEVILPALQKFVRDAPNGDVAERRRERVNICFGEGWDEERVLERYELLYEAGLVEEYHRDGGQRQAPRGAVRLGTPMVFDHRRILATAIARLRGKLKYRPVVFELMAPTFTLLELQRAVEALAGLRLHKQNFRRLVNEQGLVEGTGKFCTPARGRPAELFRFRREVLRERPAPGVRLSARRTRPG
ncbi:MAG: NAD regulator [Alphaproteobacteria bacterium]|nr:NAD regulator [Alphaproteobacteria bacterium]